jgi:2-haloalkanoic acid dehalogenase type II
VTHRHTAGVANGIRGLLLDFYGTVVHEDDEVVSRVTELIAGSVPGVDSRDVGAMWWREFSAMCVEARGSQFRRQRDIELESLRRVLSAFGSLLDADELVRDLFAYWMAPELFPEARALLASLDVPVCVVSNIDDADLDAAIALHGLDLPLRVTSESARAYKPERAMFDDALALLRLGADEVVHVGDSFRSDVLGASRLGIRSVWVNRSGRAAPDPALPTWTVERLVIPGLAQHVPLPT